jgi:hypothetical protein
MEILELNSTVLMEALLPNLSQTLSLNTQKLLRALNLQYLIKTLICLTAQIKLTQEIKENNLKLRLLTQLMLIWV